MNAHDSTPNVPQETTNDGTAETCTTNSCGTGLCSPCLLIWGGLAIYVLVTTLFFS